MLKLKADGLTVMVRECVLTLDKLAITQSVELHLGTGNLYGGRGVTWPHRSGNTCMCFYVGREHDKMEALSGTPVLTSLHWPPVNIGVHFNILLLVYKALRGPWSTVSFSLSLSLEHSEDQ